MEHHGLAFECLRVRLVGYQPTAVRSPSKLARFKGVRSGLGVEVHDFPVHGVCVRVISYDPITVGSFFVYRHRITSLFMPLS